MAERIGKEIKVVLFDHDDTLVGTIVPKWAHHKYVAKTYYGKDLTDDEIRPHWGKPFPELVCLLYGTDNTEEALANNRECHEQFPKILFDESIPTLLKLHEAGKLTGIITATSRFSFEHDLTLHGFPREIIDYTQTADDTPYHKPNPRVFEPSLVWLRERNIEPNEIVYIADGLLDMEAARGAGFNFIGVRTGLIKEDEFTGKGIYNVASIAEIASLIDQAYNLRMPERWIDYQECPPHYWIIEPASQETVAGKSMGKCKNCGNNKMFINNFDYFRSNYGRTDSSLYKKAKKERK